MTLQIPVSQPGLRAEKIQKSRRVTLLQDADMREGTAEREAEGKMYVGDDEGSEKSLDEAPEWMVDVESRKL